VVCYLVGLPPPIYCPSFSFIGGVAKEYITKLGCEKTILQGQILSTDALTPGYLNTTPAELNGGRENLSTYTYLFLNS
jgi:hypothetical protein